MLRPFFNYMYNLKWTNAEFQRDKNVKEEQAKMFILL